MTSSLSSGPPPHGWRTFLWLWASQALSVIGGIVSGFAINIYLVQTRFPEEAQKGELAAALALVVLVYTVATIFGAPLAGALADRHNRRRLMILSDTLNAALLGLGVLMVTLMTPPVWLLVAFSAAQGVLSALHSAAFDSSYGLLVSREQLPRANGMMQTLWSLSGLLGPALAAALIGVPALLRDAGVGPGWLTGLQDGVALALALDGLTFAVAALVAWRLVLPNPPQRDLKAKEARFSQDLTFGFRYIFSRPPLLNLMLTFTAFNLMVSGASVLHPLLVRYTLAGDLQAHGWSSGSGLAALYTTFSLGGLLGGVLISSWGGLKRRRVLGVLLPMMVAGAAHALSGVAGTLVLTCAALVAYGLVVPTISAHSLSIWQSQVTPDIQGRVFSVRRLVSQGTVPVSIALAGAIAAQFAPGAILLWTGLVIVLVAGLQLLNPVLRRVDDLPPALPAAPATAAP